MDNICYNIVTGKGSTYLNNLIENTKSKIYLSKQRTKQFKNRNNVTCVYFI
nr:MAG TPA: hypothetical protein [Caudoviricetes sp.]